MDKMNIGGFVLWGYGIAGFLLSIEHHSELEGLSSVRVQKYMGSIPYGGYFQGETHTSLCLHTVNPTPTPLLPVLSQNSTQFLLVSEQWYQEISRDIACTVVFVPMDTWELLIKYSPVTVRVDFTVTTREIPVWEVSTTADLQVYLEIQGFSQVEVTVFQRESPDTILRINGEPYTGKQEGIKAALCASFSSPPVSCNSVLESQGVCVSPECDFDPRISPSSLILASTAYTVGYVIGFILAILLVTGIISYLPSSLVIYQFFRRQVHTSSRYHRIPLGPAAVLYDPGMIRYGFSDCLLCHVTYLLGRFRRSDWVKVTQCLHLFHADCLNNTLVSRGLPYRCPM